MAIREAIEMEKRVEFFKGNKLTKFVLNHPKIHCKQKQNAIHIGQLLLDHGYVKYKYLFD